MACPWTLPRPLPRILGVEAHGGNGLERGLLRLERVQHRGLAAVVETDDDDADLCTEARRRDAPRPSKTSGAHRTTHRHITRRNRSPPAAALTLKHVHDTLAFSEAFLPQPAICSAVQGQHARNGKIRRAFMSPEAAVASREWKDRTYQAGYGLVEALGCGALNERIVTPAK